MKLYVPFNLKVIDSCNLFCITDETGHMAGKQQQHLDLNEIEKKEFL